MSRCCKRPWKLLTDRDMTRADLRRIPLLKGEPK